MCEEVTFYESNDEADIIEDNHKDEPFAFNKSADRILFLGKYFIKNHLCNYLYYYFFYLNLKSKIIPHLLSRSEHIN